MVGSNSVNTDPSSPPPKLSLYSLPTQRPEPPGMATPPLRVRVSVPFSWEEAPGKPRKEPAPSDPRPSPSRGLELPPRMVAEEMRSGSTSMSSSTTVLDGPFVLGRANSCYSFSFGEERSVRAGGGAVKTKERGVWSWTRGRGRKVRGDGSWEMGFGSFRGFISPSLSSSSQSSVDDSMVGDGALNAREEEANKHDSEAIRITRFRRTKSLTGASSHATTSHQLWAGIYGRLKHAVPWRKGRGV